MGSIAPAQSGFPSTLAVPPVHDNLKSQHVALETSPVRPLALSNDGTQLYVVNQPGARLAVFDIQTLNKLKEIPMGPGVTAIVTRPNSNEVWSVDSISNAVAVIDVVSGTTLHSIRVGAEPRSLAFSDNFDRAFVSCAGADRVDVISVATHSLVNSLPFPAKQPHGVAFSGGKAWVAPMLSGNNTAPRGSAPGHFANDVLEVRSLADFPTLRPLPDRDLVPILAAGAPGGELLASASSRKGLGTILFNLRLRPGTTQMWIPNTDALNAAITGEKNFIDGQVVRNRVTVVDVASAAPPMIIDLDALAPNADARCAQPTGLAFDPVRPYVYVCGYATDRVAVIDLSTAVPKWAGHIEILASSLNPPTAGPRDCIVDPQGNFLFTFNRIDSSISRIALNSLPTGVPFTTFAPPPTSLGFDPTPIKVRRGRSHANNARWSASQTSACDSCHVDGHGDGLAWDLSAFMDPEGTPAHQLSFGVDVKGPLTTQSLRALAETAPYHWRGEKPDLLSFNPAFVNLLERTINGVITPLPGDQFAYVMIYMRGFNYRPNPRQALDRSLTPQQQQGAALFRDKPVLGNASCASCHSLPLGSSGEVVESLEGSASPTTNIPQLRGLFERLSPPWQIGGDFGTRCELGAGLGHSGAFPGVREIVLQDQLGSPGVQKFAVTPAEADSLADYLSAFDNGLAPSTAYQVTANVANAQTVENNDLAFLISQATEGHCDLIYRRTLFPAGVQTFESGLFDPALGQFRLAGSGLPPYNPHALIIGALQGTPVTFIGVPLWTGRQLALDRDGDQLLDRDESLWATNPEDADTDGDALPDGYEIAWGASPTVPSGAVADNTAPALLGQPQLVYATQTAIKFEFFTDEMARVQISLNGGPVVQRIPFGPPAYDNRFSVILGPLEAGTNYSINLELSDPSDNARNVPVAFATQARMFPLPVSIGGIALRALPASDAATPPGLVAHASVELLARGSAPPPGYLVRARVFREDAAGSLTMVDPAASASSDASGKAQFLVPLGVASGISGTVHFAVYEILAPPGAPPYIRGFSPSISASAGF